MIALYILLAVGMVVAGPWALELIHAKTRLLPMGYLLAVVAFFFFETHRFNHVILVSAFNRFPFWKADILTGVAIAAGGLFVLSHAPLCAFLAWMFICGACSIFWWPVVESLKLLNLTFAGYLRGILFPAKQA